MTLELRCLGPLGGHRGRDREAAAIRLGPGLPHGGPACSSGQDRGRGTRRCPGHSADRSARLDDPFVPAPLLGHGARRVQAPNRHFEQVHDLALAAVRLDGHAPPWDGATRPSSAPPSVPRRGRVSRGARRAPGTSACQKACRVDRISADSPFQICLDRSLVRRFSRSRPRIGGGRRTWTGRLRRPGTFASSRPCLRGGRCPVFRTVDSVRLKRVARCGPPSARRRNPGASRIQSGCRPPPRKPSPGGAARGDRHRLIDPPHARYAPSRVGGLRGRHLRRNHSNWSLGDLSAA